jgi:hypothetical protein
MDSPLRVPGRNWPCWHFDLTQCKWIWSSDLQNPKRLNLCLMPVALW